MAGFSAFTKNGNTQQDIVKTKEEQIKDIEGDIKMLLGKGASSNDTRITSLRNEIKRLKLKNK